MSNKLVPNEVIENKIYLMRGMKVMLDRDLAQLYGVPTFRLNEQVKRNIDRFPSDFMFQLGRGEYEVLRSHFGASNLRSQIAISSWGGRRYLPYAFTEQGVAMLSSVLNSKRAVQVNIAIMRAFVKLRQILSTHADLRRKIEEMEKKYDGQFKVVFDAIRALMEPPPPKQKKIGFT
jgi:hypothetical protein